MNEVKNISSDQIYNQIFRRDIDRITNDELGLMFKTNGEIYTQITESVASQINYNLINQFSNPTTNNPVIAIQVRNIIHFQIHHQLSEPVGKQTNIQLIENNEKMLIPVTENKFVNG